MYRCLSGMGNHWVLRIHCRTVCFKVLVLHLGLNSDLLKRDFILYYLKYHSKQFCTIQRAKNMHETSSMCP